MTGRSPSACTWPSPRPPRGWSRRPGTACPPTPTRPARSWSSSRTPASSSTGSRPWASTTPRTSTTATSGRPRTRCSSGAPRWRSRSSRSSRPPPPERSGDAELVALGVEHHHVAELAVVELLAHPGRPRRLQLGHPFVHEPVPLDGVPRRLAGYPDVDVHAVLGGLALGHPQEADRRAATLRVDDRGVVGPVEARFGHVAQRLRPEGREPLRVAGVASQGPVRGHGGTLAPTGDTRAAGGGHGILRRRPSAGRR